MSGPEAVMDSPMCWSMPRRKENLTKKLTKTVSNFFFALLKGSLVKIEN